MMWLVKRRGTHGFDCECDVVNTVKHHTAHHAWQLARLEGLPPFGACDVEQVTHDDLQRMCRERMLATITPWLVNEELGGL